MLADSENEGLRPASVVFPLSCRKYYKFAVAEGRAHPAHHTHSSHFDLKKTTFTKDALRALEAHCEKLDINISVFSVPDEDVCGRLMQVAILASNAAIIGAEDSDTYADIKEYCDEFYHDDELDATNPLNRLWVRTQQVITLTELPGVMRDVFSYVGDDTVPPFKKVRALIMLFPQYIDRGGEESSEYNRTTRKAILESVRDNGCYYMDWGVYKEDTTLFALDLLADCPKEAVDDAIELLCSTFTNLNRGDLEEFREDNNFDTRDDRYIKHASAMGIGALGHAETANLLRRLGRNYSYNDNEQIGTALRTDFVGIAQYFERFTLLHRDRVEQRLENPLCVYDDINDAVIRALETEEFDWLNCKEALITKFLDKHDIYIMREEAYAYIRGVELGQEAKGGTITTDELKTLKGTLREILESNDPIDFEPLHAELMNWPHFVDSASDEDNANLREEGATRVVEIILLLFHTVRSTKPAHFFMDGTGNGPDTCGYKKNEIVRILGGEMKTSLRGLTDEQIKKFAARIVGNNPGESSFRIFPSYAKGHEMPVLMSIDQNDVVEAAWALYPQFMKAGRTTGDISRPNTATEALAKALVRKKMKTLFADNATKHMRCDFETATFFGTALLCSLLTSARLTAKSKRGRYNAEDLDSIASAVVDIKQTVVGDWHTKMRKKKLAFEGVESPVLGVLAGRCLGEGLSAPTAEQLYPAAPRVPTKVLRTDLDREVHYVRGMPTDDPAMIPLPRDVNIERIKGINDVDAVWGTSAMPKRSLIATLPVYEHKQFHEKREKEAHKGFGEFRRAHADFEGVEDLWGPLTANPVWTGYGSFEIMAQIMPNLGQKSEEIASAAGGEIWSLLYAKRDNGELTTGQLKLFSELQEDPVHVEWGYAAGARNKNIGIEVENMGYDLGEGWKKRESSGKGEGWLFDKSIYGESLDGNAEMKSGNFVVVTLTGECIFVEVDVGGVRDDSDLVSGGGSVFD